MRHTHEKPAPTTGPVSSEQQHHSARDFDDVRSAGGGASELSTGPDVHAGHHHTRHDKHAGHDPEQFRRRFWLSLLLTIPLVVTSEMVMEWFGYSLDLP